MNKKAVKTIGLIMIIILLSKLLGLARDMFLAGYYGSGPILDAFTTASDIPLKFFDLAFGAAVTSTFIPVYNTYLNTKKEEGFLFASRFINIVFIVISLVCILGIIFSNQLIAMFIPGASAEARMLAARLLRIMFPAAAIAGLAFSMISILQSMGQFTVPAMISLFPNVLMIGYLIFFNERFGVTGLAVAFLLAWVLQVVVQLPFIARKGFQYSLSLRIDDPGIKKVSRMVLPILVSSWVTPVSLFILAAVASYLGEGAVTSIRLSNRLYLILAGIFVFAMMNYLFPLMSRQAIEPDTTEFRETYRRAFENLCFFIIPLSVGALVLSGDMISLLYERGQFTKDAAGMMAVAFAGFTPAIFGYSLYEITSKAYYAGKKVLVPTVISLATLISTLVLSCIVVFVTNLGIGFVSLSFSLSILISSVVMVVLFNKANGRIIESRSRNELLRSILGSAVMGACIVAFRELFMKGDGLTFGMRLFLTFAVAIVGLMVYSLTMALMKSPTFMYYFNWVKEKAGRRG